MTYRDLTGDDVLQAGDIYKMKRHWSSFQYVPNRLIGRSVGSIVDYEYVFRRKLTPAEITAAERLRFEAWNIDCGLKPNQLVKDGHGDYFVPLTFDNWRAWCAAVGCDPMGDV
jgi:hypothetical protein